MNVDRLHFARHLLRRAHEDAVRTDSPDLHLWAAAHDELCELMGRLRLLWYMCQLSEHDSGHGSEVRQLSAIIEAIGLDVPIEIPAPAVQRREQTAQTQLDL